MFRQPSLLGGRHLHFPASVLHHQAAHREYTTIRDDIDLSHLLQTDSPTTSPMGSRLDLNTLYFVPHDAARKRGGARFALPPLSPPPQPQPQPPQPPDAAVSSSSKAARSQQHRKQTAHSDGSLGDTALSEAGRKSLVFTLFILQFPFLLLKVLQAPCRWIAFSTTRQCLLNTVAASSARWPTS